MRVVRFGAFVLALGLWGPATLEAANYPFPQAASLAYSFGIKPANPFGASWSADYTTLQNKWGTYKANYVTSNGAGGNLRVQRPEASNDTVSEGMGYGMILAVYFNDQTTFNGLWAYEQAHRDSLGLMNWDINSGGGVIGANSASDGDEDITYALWLAHYQWGDGTGTNYTTLATNQTALVQQNDIDSNGRIKPGDSFDSCQYPSYFMPSDYVVFGKQTGQAFTWNNAITNSYQTINDACNTSSGLIADQTGDTGVGGGCGGTSSTDDQYNSCRVPFYMTLDYLYYGTANSQTELGRLQPYFNAIQPSAVVDCYVVNQGGTSATCSGNTGHSAFVGPAGCALMRSSASAAMLQTYYNTLMAYGTSSYFDDSWNLLSLLLMQGNMPNIADPASIYTPTPSPTATPYAGTPTATFTATPIANGIVFEDFEYGQLSDGYTYADTATAPACTSSQSVSSSVAHTGLYSDNILWSLTSGGTSGQYAGVGFNSNYADNLGVVDAAGTTSVQFAIKTNATLSLTISFKEGGNTTTAVAGGHGILWDSPPIAVPAAAGWQIVSVPLANFLWDKYSNPATTNTYGYTMALASMMTCQIQTTSVVTGAIVYVDDIDFMPTTAFTPTPTATPFNNPYTQIWDDFESPKSLSLPAYSGTFADAVTGASAAWAITTVSGDYVDGTHGGALTYNTGTTAGYGCGGDDVSPYSNAQLYSDDSGAVYLAFWIKATAGLRFQMEFQEAGTTKTAVDGADGAAWLSSMQTAAPGSNGWEYMELPIADFTEDPYNTQCNPAGLNPSPCLNEGDTQQLQALSSVSIKIPGGQGSGVVDFDDIAFITTWKTPTPSASPTGSVTFTRSPSASTTPSATASPTGTYTASPTATYSDSPTATYTVSPTPSFTASPTPSFTASPMPSFTASPTLTNTPTGSPTVSDSPTGTPTYTNVPTGSSPTDTYTVTDTPSISPTGTPSVSPSQTYTLTATLTQSPSNTPTGSVSPSDTPSPSLTASPSFTPSLTPASPTDTPIDSPTQTDTPSVTNTPASPTPTDTLTATGSPTDTPSVTNTPASPTPTDTPTATGSPTGTPTSPTPTDTQTVTGSPTDSASSSPSATLTNTPSPTSTASPTPGGSPATPTPQVPVIASLSPATASAAGGFVITVTGTNIAPGASIVVNGTPLVTSETAGAWGTMVLTATAPALSGTAATVSVADPSYQTFAGKITLNQGTATPGPVTGNPILSTLPGPDPNPAGIWVDLRMPVDSVRLTVYTAAYRLVGSYSSGPLSAGWNEVPLPFAPGSIGNGIYYYVVESTKNGSSLKGPKTGKFYLLASSGSSGGGGWY